jgi:hypothetical protein
MRVTLSGEERIRGDDRDRTVFTKNRQRLLEGNVATAFLKRVVEQARPLGLLLGEPFTVDGTLLEAWASLKSFKCQGEAAPPPDYPDNPTVSVHAGATQATGTAECQAGVEMARALPAGGRWAPTRAMTPRRSWRPFAASG